MKITLQNLINRYYFDMKSVLITALALFTVITTNAQNDDIYVAGDVGKIGKIWKNNVELYSAENEEYSVGFDCIYVAGDDIYTGGTYSKNTVYFPVVYKNGQLLHRLSTEEQGYANSVAISKNSVYTCGSIGYDAVVWKDDKVLDTLGRGGYNSGGSTTRYIYANSIQIVGNDIYVAGYTSAGIGRIWKNGAELYSIEESGIKYTLEGIAVSGNDIYAVGYSDNNMGIVWKNGTELYSEPGRFFAMCVSDNNIYVTGYTLVGSGKSAKVWKNGELLYQLTDGTNDTRGRDICVIDNDVYVLTRKFASTSQDIVWKNGVQFYDMESQHAEAICFPSSNINSITNVEKSNFQIYPNPAKNELFIDGEIYNSNIEIYNIKGEKILTDKLTESKSINISSLPIGIYVLKIGNHYEKFIKE
ncbi:T9SS type A sorting domain-containing protein [Odoribacter sp. OttesenSCG-928-L07]|nr:T9SS type A sorting domain-containing protein [Odoribacter sp. OttesenSCG-928-L07]MDL2239206.1 T9SS type A sorting domain-containing protein [Bacteroidales bacterium OttesenSCG-928-L14]MDL2240550.1 T9SS type A sorting domain-containing protein [Bacteroidales bacterium OttesenSCG-928-K22]